MPPIPVRTARNILRVHKATAKVGSAAQKYGFEESVKVNCPFLIKRIGPSRADNTATGT